jgi:UDP-glucose 4-epimerase
MAPGDNINISTDNTCSVEDLISRICAHYGYRGEILRKEARKADVLCHIASNAKVKSLIEYLLTSFDQGLRDTLDWYARRLGDRRAA